MFFRVSKKPSNIGCTLFLSFCFLSSFYAQELTDEWTGSGSERTVTSCGITISTAVTNEQNGAFTNFANDDIGCNMPNTFSNNGVVGQPALAPFLGYGITGGSGVLTFNFTMAVTNPVLHIDRLGGGADSNATSALITMITPGITLQRLSGNGAHFEVNGNEITRTPDQTLTATPNQECDISTVGVAAGSIRLNGTFTTVSFRYEQNGSGGDADAIEVVWELFCIPPIIDFDNDGIADVDDLDDDNDGILDTVEQNNIPTLDTDNDGFIDALDLDSDGDGCNDVIEAGFEDLDENGTLGTAPDDVDTNGLIINAIDGYTIPNDLNNNSIFDFQETINGFILQHPMDTIVCQEENAQFQVVVENSTSVTWEISTDGGTTWNDVPNTASYSGINSETLNITDSLFSMDGNLFRIRLEAATSVCDPVVYSETSELQVLEIANAGQDADVEMCSNDESINLLETLGAGTDAGGIWSPSLNNDNNMFNPNINSAGIYTYTIGSGNCQDSATVNIIIGNGPEITAVDISNNENIINVDITVLNPAENEFSLDNITFQNENTFENLDAGEYTIYVRSLNGCGTVTETFEINGIYDYPKFFTPNQDGINDTWQIEQDRLTNSETFIYDRYGKLLKVLLGENEFWDGTYQNQRMPSTDYWFKAISNEVIILKGHFTLKR